MNSAKDIPEIPNLSDDYIRARADEARSKCCGESAYLFSFNVDEMVENLGLQIIPLPNLLSEFNIDGFLNYPDREIVVDESAYDSIDQWTRLRFTVAHEIGHFMLHSDFFSKLDFRTMQEWAEVYLKIDGHTKLEEQANEFAGRFLVPREHLELMITEEKERIVNRTGVDLQRILATRIAKKMLVSSVVVDIRFRVEKLMHLIR